jgi:hypothetical protein
MTFAQVECLELVWLNYDIITEESFTWLQGWLGDSACNHYKYKPCNQRIIATKVAGDSLSSHFHVQVFK